MNSTTQTKIVATIKEALEGGVVPWLKPWNAGTNIPMKLSEGKPYQGSNTLFLHCEQELRGYASNWWGSYKQINELGGKIIKGSSATPVVYWFRTEGKENAKTGKTEEGFLLCRHINVFNASQADWGDEGIPEKYLIKKTSENEFSPIEAAEKIVASYEGCPAINHGQNGAYYRPSNDTVGMPDKDAFHSEEEYYSTLFHELGHSTGAEKRLDRDLSGLFGAHCYSKEELVAELTATFLMGEAGISERTIDNSAAYIGHWLKNLEDDPSIFTWAASRAQKASALIQGAAGQKGSTATSLVPISHYSQIKEVA